MAGRIMRPGTGPIYRGNRSGIFAPGVGRIGGHDASLGGAGAYLGAVATRTFINDLTGASTAGWNCRTAHYARDGISSLQLVFNNIYVVPGTGETAIPGTQTITASVEYPAGTFTQVKFNGGNTSVVLSGLTQIVSDPVAVSIPNGAKFFTRRYQVVSSTIAFVNNTSRSMNVALGDAVNSNSIDQTMSGTITDSGASCMVPPAAIIGMTRRPSIGIIGSSRVTGYRDRTPDATGNSGYDRMFGGSFAYIDCAVAGDKTRSVEVAGGAMRRALIAAYCSHLWLDPGLNDLNTGSTAAQVMTSLGNMAAAWPGGLGRVLINNEGPWTTSTDAWITTANQTVTAWEAQRVTLNTSIAALTGYNQVVDVASVASNGTNGQFWNNPAVGGSQVTTDGIHENAATCIAIAAAGKFNPALVHRP